MYHARSDYQRIQDPAGLIGEDEPVMLFRAKDKYFIHILKCYAKALREDPDVQPEMIKAVEEHILRAAGWAAKHTTKTPDI